MSLPSPNRSILVCPNCRKPLVNVGSKMERIHPVCCFMEKYYVSTLLVSSLLIYLALVTTAHFTSLGSPFSLGLGTVALFSLPFTIMYFLKRAFSLYRVTDCPYCRYHEEQKLGRSFSG